MSEQSKFKVGDHVRIINYGSLIWINKKFYEYKLDLPIIAEHGNIIFMDMSPELVGQKGTISKVSNPQGKSQYSLSGIKGKVSWYNDDQLEKI